MKEILLFEGELSDPGVDEVLPKLISKAVETDQDVFVRWNSATIRVSPPSTVEELMAEYNEQLHVNAMYNRLKAPEDGRDKILYRITNGLGTFYVVSRTFDEAAELLQKRLNHSDYGYTSSREVKSIEVIAIEHFFSDKQAFSGDNDKLVVEG